MGVSHMGHAQNALCDPAKVTGCIWPWYTAGTLRLLAVSKIQQHFGSHKTNYDISTIFSTNSSTCDVTVDGTPLGGS